MSKPIYRPEYGESWALVIGINEYKHVTHLGYACSDAEAVAEALKDKFGFPEDHVTLLLDDEADWYSIRYSFLSLADDRTGPDDRLFVFYAGHGHTRMGARGEIGFLVPVDGNIDDLASLLRWDDLTRNAELIRAKHILFVMDACYGGLALTRGVTGGSVRFLRDMLQRFSRQVLTAGKANEVVADSGGPIPGHSVFTGHLLQALGGMAAYGDGIMTANTLMAYVYEHVAKDPHSKQTPHFGLIEGDGDFIFQAPVLKALEAEKEKGKDVLFEVPVTTAPAEEAAAPSLLDAVKEFLADEKFRIKLHDMVIAEIRRAMSMTTEDEFPVQTKDVTVEEFAERLRRYETVMTDMMTVMLCLTHWGDDRQVPLIQKCISRLADHFKATGGKTVWLSLRWYPTMLLSYAGGLGALAADRYTNLASVFLARVPSLLEAGKEEPAILVTEKAALELARTDAFKLLPGHERYYVPRSEYLFKVLQPIADDVLFVGKGYESLFDRYEVLQALVYADLYEEQGRHIWGPIGRFGWKFGGLRREENPFANIFKEAEEQKGDWPPLQAGLFQGSYDRFSHVATAYAELLKGLNWF